MPSFGSIFISYRRSDTIAETGRIYDRLVREFSREQIFKDVDDIPFGVDFAEHLEHAVSQCQILLVIIGKTWITTTELDGTRRIDNPDDFVRIEIEAALKRNIPVIPLLLEGVSMPRRSQLPESLHLLARRNGTTIGHDPRFHTDMDRLIKGIQPLINNAKAVPQPVAQPPVAQPPVAQPPAPTFTFEVVSIDAKGKIRHREQKSAEYRKEVLGQGIELELVALPAGTFHMGSASGQGDDGERPQHQVSVPPFLIGKYPVTQAQWRVVSTFERVDIDLTPYPSAFEGDNRPVEQVTWDDAIEFCKRLSKQTNRTYRLPSEAEWEYACRAGTATPFHFGETLTSELANYDANYTYGSGPKGKYRQHTTDVGSFPANAFGLYDMHGNLWEWCEDHWHPNYEGAPTDGSAWKTTDTNASRLLRGGSWSSNPDYCRSANRGRVARVNRGNYIGFRVVCAASWTLV
ncbi:MAG: SUMF1/EgtB/PvdO family nonheme iron enzyme [Phormidesmis sp. RL_2_1]|nr:SUMF1/EgtB/PvdO family nonheme iron enzyme [Phormidesmis sp. RL_2_1]